MPARLVNRLALALVLAVAACDVRPAGADPASGKTVDGVRCDQMEGSQFHIHQHVTILDHGRPVKIPEDVGRPVVAGCFYWIHTHTSDGIVHIEAPSVRDFTLGQFFDIWGEPLDATHVASATIRKGELHAFVGGHAYAGDPRSIPLTSRADIVLEAGAPYRKPVAYTAWGDL